MTSSLSSPSEILEQQRQSWNKFAPGWKKWDQFVLNFLKPAGDAILAQAQLKPGMRVLDAACGTGEPGLTAANIVGAYGRVVGADLSEEMVAMAQEKAKAAGLKNYEVRVADTADLPFETKSFDAVICRMGVMFFPEPEKAISEFYRVMKTGGRVALCAWAEPQKNDWATVIGDIVRTELKLPPPSPALPGLFRQSKPVTLKAMLERAGFKQVREQQTKGECAYQSAQQYWEFMTDVAAPIAAALAKTDQKTRDFIKARVLKAADGFKRGGGPVLAWSAWVASGVKS